MRVVAFWAGIAGLFVAAAQAAALILSRLDGADAALIEAAREAAAWGLVGFTLLTAAFLLIVACTDRKV